MRRFVFQKLFQTKLSLVSLVLCHAKLLYTECFTCELVWNNICSFSYPLSLQGVWWAGALLNFFLGHKMWPSHIPPDIFTPNPCRCDTGRVCHPNRRVHTNQDQAIFTTFSPLTCLANLADKKEQLIKDEIYQTLNIICTYILYDLRF